MEEDNVQTLEGLEPQRLLDTLHIGYRDKWRRQLDAGMLELRQWYFGDEEALVYLYDHYDRSHCNLSHQKPGEFSHDDANWRIRYYVDVYYNGTGFFRAIVLDGKVVGCVGITLFKDVFAASCELEMFLLPEACGQGIGTVVLKEMTDFAFNGPQNYEALLLKVNAGNAAAIRMCEKAGLERAGQEGDGERLMYYYRICRPSREMTDTGVELRPWKRRDLRELLHLYETVDRRYDDLPDHTERLRQSWIRQNNCDPTPEWMYEHMLYIMGDYVDQWNVGENNGGDLFRAIVYNGAVVGLAMVTQHTGKRSHDAELGYMLMPEYCGMGIATQAAHMMIDEAFSHNPQLQRITAWVYAPNEASKRVLQKNGFRLEGVQKEAVMCEGVPVDHLVYGLLRKDFRGIELNNQTKMEF